MKHLYCAAALAIDTFSEEDGTTNDSWVGSIAVDATNEDEEKPSKGLENGFIKAKQQDDKSTSSESSDSWDQEDSFDQGRSTTNAEDLEHLLNSSESNER